MKLTCTQRDLLNGHIELLRAEATVKRQQGLEEERKAHAGGGIPPWRLSSPGTRLYLDAANLNEIADLVETLASEVRP